MIGVGGEVNRSCLIELLQGPYVPKNVISFGTLYQCVLASQLRLGSRKCRAFFRELQGCLRQALASSQISISPLYFDVDSWYFSNIMGSARQIHFAMYPSFSSLIIFHNFLSH